MQNLSIEFIKNFVEIHSTIAYFLLSLGIIVEGDVVVIFAGIFSHLGSLNPFIAYGFIFIGGIIRSFFGYTLGSYLHKNHSHNIYLSRVRTRVDYFLPRFKNKPFWSIFISRFFILGIGWFTLVYSGLKQVPLKVYVKAEAISLVVWSVSMMCIGYFFSQTALSISKDIRKFIAIILILFIIFFVLEKMLTFFLENYEALSKKKKEMKQLKQDVDFK